MQTGPPEMLADAARLGAALGRGSAADAQRALALVLSRRSRWGCIPVTLAAGAVPTTDHLRAAARVEGPCNGDVDAAAGVLAPLQVLLRAVVASHPEQCIAACLREMEGSAGPQYPAFPSLYAAYVTNALEDTVRRLPA